MFKVPVPSREDQCPGKATIEVQPGGSGQVKFLMITSGIYDPKLTYHVDGDIPIQPDAPQLLAGNGAVGLVGPTQRQFVFTNGTGKPASIEILVGRKATT